MVKVRFSTADVAAEVACLSSAVIGFRVSNVYDVNAKTYLLKLHRSGGEGREAEKRLLVIESGVRFHLTKYTRDKNEDPTNFSLKLRKHIRTKRIESVRQLGIDRIVDFTMGSGPARHHLILELYSQGNLILTDADYKILTLLRSHRDDANDFVIMANHPYPADACRMLHEHSAEDLARILAEASGGKLKSAVSRLISHGPMVAEHCVLSAGLEPGLILGSGGELNAEEVHRLAMAVNEVEAELCFQPKGGEGVPPRGYIFTRPVPQGPAIAAQAASGGDVGVGGDVTYDSFEPFLPQQSEGKDRMELETFDEAVDEFFSKVESQKLQVQQAQQKSHVAGKIEKIRADQDTRAAALRREASSTNAQAQLIECNLDIVDEAIVAVNQALASGMDWEDLQQMVLSEQQAGNPVARVIHSLQLHKNRATLLLRDPFEEAEEGVEGGQERKVEVDLGLSAHANASALFQTRKRRDAKQVKTVEASARALEQAQRQAQVQMKKLKVSNSFKVARKVYWFEKFDWFVSSENYLVVGGRDAQQNELLVKRYMKRHDLYVHADVHGAASCLVKNRAQGGRVPPSTLLQAGGFCVCHSQAWASKFTTGAWWVNSKQVSKTAPSGEYLTTGSFMIRGRKNYLPPTQLLMGFTVLFKLDEISVEAHAGERGVRAKDDEAEAREGATTAGVGGSDSDDSASANGSEASDEEGEQGRAAGGHSAQESGEFRDGEASSSESEPESNLLDDPGAPAGSQLDVLSTPVIRTRVVLPDMPASAAEGLGEAGGGSGNGAEREGRRRLTAKERRQQRKLRKGGGKEDPEDEDSDGNGDAGEGPSEPEPMVPPKRPKQAPPPKQVRGRRGKKKRMAKYADQDEEDRELAMMLLGSSGGKGGKAKGGNRTQDTPRQAGGAEEKEKTTPASPGGTKAPAESRGNGGGLHGEPGRQGDLSSGVAEAGAPLDVPLPLTETEADRPDGGDADLHVLNSLTGRPTPDDVILFCLPMCAPYWSIQNNNYKVKLTPGTMRKGKASKAAIEMMVRSNKPPPREIELLKSIPEAELVASMVGNVKLSMPGLSKVMQGKKQSKKSKKSKKR